MSNLPTARNLRYSVGQAMVDINGGPSFPMQQYLANLGRVLESMYTVNVQNFGASGADTFEDTEAFSQAIQDVINHGGGTIIIPAGTYKVNSVTVPAGVVPVRFVGEGVSTIVKRTGVVAPGKGIFDVWGSNVTFENFVIDGDTLTPVGLQYGVNFVGVTSNDPMATSLTQNTSVWIHGASENFYFYRMTFQHAGGYSILADAMLGDINNIAIINSTFKNNRPTLFGTVPGDLIYGSWNGGVFLKGNGAVGTGVINHVYVSGCSFFRNNGNCIWSHLYSLDRLHSDFRFVDNSFEDCGLDGILMGGLTGGIVLGNTFRRVGYTTLTDTDQSIPRWGALNATALDSSGLVKNCPYIGNSFISVNGGALDLDGHCDSSVSDNVVRTPAPGEIEYTEDQIAISGPTNSGPHGYGVNIGNTSATPWGATNINITGNTFLNLFGGSIRMYGARFCSAQANLIVVPDVPVNPPIALGPISANPNQRCYNNRVSHNHCSYSPAAPAPLVEEDNSLDPFSGSEANYVFGNVPIIGNGSAIEFQPSGTSGSPTYLETVWFV